MVLLGIREEWHFCHSTRKCCYPNCCGEAIIVERKSGRVLCSYHAHLNPSSLESARLNIKNKINDIDINPSGEHGSDFLDELLSDLNI